MIKGMKFLGACLLMGALTTGSQAWAAKDNGVKTRAGTARYIVLLDAPTLVGEMTALERSLGQSPEAADLRGPRGMLDLRSDRAREQLQEIDARLESFRTEASGVLGREVQPVHRYRAALNGFSVRLDAKEARRLAKLDGVRAVVLDEAFKLQTDAGPAWLGADRVWAGEGFLPANRGEGVIVGIIDSGINWEHPSFADPGEGAPINTTNHDHENPLGRQLGLCSEPEVLCNDKLIGVYDFVEDDPDTEVVEEFNNGADNGTHGAHTASTAAGNPVTFTLVNGAPIPISGVAPNANIISYRVCYAGDPSDPEDDACQGSAILQAIDQAILDGVHVINYSIGGSAFDPWVAPDTLAFLEAVEAGIFVATSAGNSGPGAGSMGRPANAPWITAVGNATHDRVLAGILKATQGGATTPPGDLVGTTLTQESASIRPIVHAKDFGFPLCGTGTPELQPTCDGNTGASNPFAPGTFDGEIVVCDRGTYGRVEKGKNLLEAGAGGYVLANTEITGGESTDVDQHCLPATHLSASRGDILRDWLDSGSGHQASLTGFLFFNDDAFADRINVSSSRGPNPAPVQDVLKPNLIAPGTFIIAADNDSNGVIALTGTSMASPHVAGAAALLLADDPNLRPSQVASMLELTATDAIARDENLLPATPLETGAGRPRVYEAATIGVYLEETAQNFLDADPFEGGDPRNLNLPTLTDATCQGTCSFTRSIGSFVSGRNWTFSTSGFPAGVEVTVTPSSVVIPAGETRDIQVDIDWTGAEVADQWVFGKVHIDNPSFPQATMPVSFYASLGELPSEWVIQTEASSGFRDFPLSGLGELTQASFHTGGLQPAEQVRFNLREDPTFDDPYDDSDGVVTILFDVPAKALWLHAETLASPSEDLDLYVGFDSNGDGKASRSEELCFSASFDDLEFCDIFNPQQGVWWVVVQNWEDGEDLPPGEGPAQAVDFVSLLVVESDDSTLTATGPGYADALASLNVRLSWDDVTVPGGSTLYGAVALGSAEGKRADVGVVPVRLQRQDVAAPATLALMDGREEAFALRANTSHEKLFIDVPPGVTGLQVNVAGGSVAQNNDLELDLYRVPFDQAFGEAPEAAPIPNSINPAVSAAGTGGQGPSAVINDFVEAGRWYVVVSNSGSASASVRVQVSLTYDDNPANVYGGLWSPSSRPGINQGYEYTPVGANRAFLWYTYDRDGSPVWYQAAGPEATGNNWIADLFRFTNDGTKQQGTRVGQVTITQLDEDDAIFSWTLNGVSGSDRTSPLPRTCPDSVTPTQNFTGVWYRGSSGLGGASILANRADQGQVHYLYDGRGRPRWLLAAGDFRLAPTTLDLRQFKGFCPSCTGVVTSEVVGQLDMEYDSNAAGAWTLDYTFAAPAVGGVNRTDDVVRLSDGLQCAN